MVSTGISRPRILVTGATGFIGPHILRALHAQGFALRGLRRRASPTWHLDDLKIEWV
ncbi:MAG: NAD-dependent epimerase/dehydratase family protein, partial [Bradymonadaceae bacterium]